MKRAAGVSLGKDPATGNEFVVTAHHLFQMSPVPFPRDDAHFLVKVPAGAPPDVSEGEYGHHPIADVSFNPRPGSIAIALGYPAGLYYAAGEILSATEVAQMQGSSPGPKDEYRYDPRREFYVRARSFQGTSGGPVFDDEGRWLGNLISGGSRIDRASGRTAYYFYHVLRAEFLLGKFAEFLEALAPGERGPFEAFRARVAWLVTMGERSRIR